MPESNPSDLPARGSTILVTGATGFVGRQLCDALVARGITVRGVARRGGEIPGASVIASDILNRAAMVQSMRGVDAVVHLAARAHVLHEVDRDPAAAYRRANVEGTRVLLDAAASSGVSRFVFVSSVKAVGESSRTPWTSATPPRPTDAYGLSKLAAEDLVRDAGGKEMSCTVLRFPLVYGPGMRANMLRLFDAVAQRRTLPFGGIHNLRSILFTGNAVGAIQTSLAAAGGREGTWFVADGPPISTAGLARAIGQSLGIDARILRIPPWCLKVAGDIGDVMKRMIPVPFDAAAAHRLTSSLVVDTGEFSAATGFRAPYTTAEGLALTAEWYRQTRGSIGEAT